MKTFIVKWFVRTEYDTVIEASSLEDAHEIIKNGVWEDIVESGDPTGYTEIEETSLQIEEEEILCDAMTMDPNLHMQLKKCQKSAKYEVAAFPSSCYLCEDCYKVNSQYRIIRIIS